MLIVAGLLIVISTLGGWLIGRQITSPAEVAARTNAPQASPILVPIESRVLSSDVVTRGTGRFGRPERLTVATSALKTQPGQVAELPLVGAELAEGGVALNASGRPLFVLVGERPMSRDLGPGLSGQDVLQLEESLVRLGFDPGPVDGQYDTGTEAAVSAWYQAAGFAPFTATAEQLTSIRLRERELATARADRFTALDSVATSQASLAAAEAAFVRAHGATAIAGRALEQARADEAAANQAAVAELATAQARLDAMRAGRSGAAGTPAEIAAARADLNTAQANARSVQLVGARNVRLAEADLAAAPARLAAAVAEANAANAAAAAEVSSRQAALAALQADENATAAQIAAAQAAVNAGVASATSVSLSGQATVANTQAASDAAPGALDAARAEADAANAASAADVASRQAALAMLEGTRVATPAEIATAERELDQIRTRAVSTARSGARVTADAAAAVEASAADVTAQTSAVNAARTAASNAGLVGGSRDIVAELAAQELDLVRRQAGVQVPADEVVFVASGPVRTAELLVGRGDPATGGVLKVTNSIVSIDGGLAVEDVGLVSVGMTVEISEPDLGIDTTGEIVSIADGPGTNGVDGFHVYFEILVNDPPPTLVGASVRLTIPIESSVTEVLAAPISALSLAADGTSHVQVVGSGGAITSIAVEPGLSADGYVAITSSDRSLAAGDLVVIGFEGTQAVPGESTTTTSGAPGA